MKRIVLAFFLMLLPLFLHSGIQSSVRQLLVSDSLNENLNQMMLNEIERRMPKDRPFFFEDRPTLMPWHRMTMLLKCTIGLSTTKIKDPQEALQLFLPYAQAYMDAINNVPEIRPYLGTFPFDFSMCAFAIEFARDPKTRLFLYDPYLACVIVHGTELRVSKFCKEKWLEGALCRNAYEEVYRAFQIFPESITQLTIPHFDEKKTSRVIPEVKKYCCVTDELKEEFHFFQDWAHKNGFVLIALDNIVNKWVAKDFKEESPFFYKANVKGEAFAAQEKYVTLEEGKKLVRELRQENISLLLPWEGVKNSLNFLRKRGQASLDPSVNLQEYMSLRLSFWDKHIDRIKPPHLAEIKVVGSQAKYYVSDELQRLQLIHEEELPPYEIEIPVPEELLKEKPQKAEAEQH